MYEANTTFAICYFLAYSAFLLFYVYKPPNSYQKKM